MFTTIIKTNFKMPVNTIKVQEVAKAVGLYYATLLEKRFRRCKANFLHLRRMALRDDLDGMGSFLHAGDRVFAFSVSNNPDATVSMERPNASIGIRQRKGFLLGNILDGGSQVKNPYN